MVYSPHEISPQWNIPSWFIAPMEKTSFYERLSFEVVTVMIKDEKIQYKRYNVNQNYFYALREVDKSNIPVVFEEFEMVYIFLLLFSFH